VKSLSSKYVKEILEYLAAKGTVNKSSLIPITHGIVTLERLLPKMVEDNLITIKKDKKKFRVYISITPKGLEILRKLRNIDASERLDIKTQKSIEIPEGLGQKIMELRSKMAALIHLNVLDDHISLIEKNYDGSGKDRIVDIYVKETKKKLRLWCSLDESYECYHVMVAWGLPEVQDLIVKKAEERGVAELRDELMDKMKEMIYTVYRSEIDELKATILAQKKDIEMLTKKLKEFEDKII
jgi:DNA-binding PadR family transcriptional regulator